MNRTPAESMLSHAQLPNKFWAETVSTAAFIRNRTAMIENESTLYKRWYNERPNVSQFKVFGVSAMHIYQISNDKS